MLKRGDLIILSKINWRLMISHPACCLAFGLGIGLMPIAPGTWGSLSVLPIAWLCFILNLPSFVLLSLAGLLFFLGAWSCQITHRTIGIQDYGGIVIDEMVAMLALLSLLPFSWGWWLVGFVLFRLIDIIKPWPIGWVDVNIKNGWGVMLDDVIAAGYVLLIYWLFDPI